MIITLASGNSASEFVEVNKRYGGYFSYYWSIDSLGLPGSVNFRVK